MQRFPSSGSSTGPSTQPINSTRKVLQNGNIQTPQSSQASAYYANTQNYSTQTSNLNSNANQYKENNRRGSTNGNRRQNGNGRILQTPQSTQTNEYKENNRRGSTQPISSTRKVLQNGNIQTPQSSQASAYYANTQNYSTQTSNLNSNANQYKENNRRGSTNGNRRQNGNGRILQTPQSTQTNEYKENNRRGSTNGNGNYYINNNNKLKKNDFVYNNTSPWPMIPLGSHMGQSVFMQDYLIRNFNKAARQKFMKNVKYEYVNNLKINGKNLGPTLILSTLKNKLTKEIEHEQKCIEEKKKLDTAFDNYVKCLKENGIITNTNKMKSNYNKMINDLNNSSNGIINQTPMRLTKEQKQKEPMADPRQTAKEMRGKQLRFKEPLN